MANPSIRERVFNRLGLVTGTELETQVRRAYESGYYDGGEDEPATSVHRQYGYRATTSGLRDFTRIDRDRILEIVWTLWQSNPVADRSLEIKRDYILGRGVQIVAEDEDLQEIIDRFIEINRLSARIKEFVLQLYLFGVQCYPVFVKKSDGTVRLGYFDPSEIEDVIPHPDNAMEMYAVVIKERMSDQPWIESYPKRVYRIVRVEDGAGAWDDTDYQGSGDEWVQALFDAAARGEQVGQEVTGGHQSRLEKVRGKLVTAEQAVIEPWEKRMLEALGREKYDGTVIYVKVNSVSNQPWGYSDLLQVADWLDQGDETLFSLADREQTAGYFSWDVTLTGADDNKVKARSAELRQAPPRRGSVNVHNDAEAWRFDFPDLKTNASIETSNAIQTHAIGGLGYPNHWYGRGDETNRATAQAQNDPTWRTLEHDQDTVRDLLLLFATLVRDQALLAGTWRKTPSVLAQRQMQPAEESVGQEGAAEEKSDQIEVTMPEMTTRDIGMVSTALSSVASSLVVAEEARWHTKAKSREIWAKALAEFGVELDATKMTEELGEDDETVRQVIPGGLGAYRQPAEGVMWPPSETVIEGPEDWNKLTWSQKEMLLAAFMERVGIGQARDVAAEALGELEAVPVD